MAADPFPPTTTTVPDPPQVAHTHRLRVSVAPSDPDGCLSAVRAALAAAGGAVQRTDRPDNPQDGATGQVAEIVVRAAGPSHARALAHAAGAVDGVEVLDVTDVVLELHEGGKIAITTKRPVNGPEDLALVYSPGVARVSSIIAADPSRARDLTVKRNSVAVVSDGSAVLGLGDIGPAAAMPVMEGKAMLLKEFAGVDAWPICLDERDPDKLVDIIAALSVGFGGINLEDISAPRCFEVEGKLRQRLDIPVFHDDQHGTAIVVLAALYGAAAIVGKEVGPDLRVVVQGIGAAGIAVSNLLMAAGVVDLVGVDQDGIVTARRKDARDPIFRRFGKQTNPRNLDGQKERALAGADVFVGLSAGNTLSADQLDLMAGDAIVFAMANPTPEIDPALALQRAAVVATGRSDFPNQINNVLCFPGLFRGLLDCGAREINTDMKLAAARAIADLVGDQRRPDFVIPSPFDRDVVPAVATAVAATAASTGAATR